MLDQEGRYDETVAVGNAALKLQDEDVDDQYVTNVMTSLADSELHKHNPEACLALCRRQLEIKPNDPFGYENIAEAQLQEGDLTDARTNWKKKSRASIPVKRARRRAAFSPSTRSGY